MAKISMIICDLCNKEIKDSTVYEITLSSFEKERIDKAGEICLICYRSLLGRLNKAAHLPMVWSRESKPQTADNPEQSLDCIGVTDGSPTTLGKSTFISTPTAIKSEDGEFKVPSLAHTIKHEVVRKCTHDRTRMSEDGNSFNCLDCGEKV